MEDLEATMRKHEETLRHYRERVEQDQREAGLLMAGASLGSLPASTPPPAGASAAHHHAAAGPRDAAGDSAGFGYDMMGFGGGGSDPFAAQFPPQPNLGGTQPQHYHHQQQQQQQQQQQPHTPGYHGSHRGYSGHHGGRGASERSESTPAAGMGVQDEPGLSRPRGKKTAHPLRVYDRVSQWQRRKEQKMEEERRRNQEKEVEGCSFAPTTRSNRPPVAPRQGSIYGGNGRAWGYDEFVERQREARRRNSEKQEMVKYTGKNWKNKPTVPVEFQLGRRDRSIKALQKPLSPPTFVASVSEHHHLAKEVAQLAQDSPLAQLAGNGVVQRGLFSERTTSAILDKQTLHPVDDDDYGYGEHGASEQQSMGYGRSQSPNREGDAEWVRRSAEKQTLETQLQGYSARPW